MIKSLWSLVIRTWSFPPVVALRIELSAARLSAELGQPALDYLEIQKQSVIKSSGIANRTRVAWLMRPRVETNTTSRRIWEIGYLGVEPKTSCSQSRRAPICTSTRCCFSVRTARFEPQAPTGTVAGWSPWPPAKRDRQPSPRSDS